MNFRIQRASASLVPRFCCAIFLFMSLLFQKSTAQNATLDPSEVEVLNSLFKQWNMQSTTFWNMSGEPCRGSAINETQFYDEVNKQAIMCNCTYNDNTTCHITHLKVLSLNKTGEIPEELTTLTYLMVLRLDKNYFTGPLPSFIANLSQMQYLGSYEAYYISSSCRLKSTRPEETSFASNDQHTPFPYGVVG